ncbi:site-specific DNA-methyltransferase, partial [Campylobacter jejuni]|nr:site-specific DNA-methyltransferase [Campylobacter jejuni]
DSTWLSLMHNRLELAKEFLSDKGNFYLHLDENADYFGRILLNEFFGEMECKKLHLIQMPPKMKKLIYLDIKALVIILFLKKLNYSFLKKTNSIFNKTVEAK